MQGIKIVGNKIINKKGLYKIYRISGGLNNILQKLF